MSTSPVAGASNPPGLPADIPAGFTPGWLQDALRAGGADASVEEVVGIEPVGTGQMASCYRIELRGSGDTPASVVAKVAAANAGDLAANGYRAELRFYDGVAPHAAGRLARCYYSVANETATEFVLLLEDLAPAKQGDQIAGATPEQVALALANLADLHGSLWEHDALGAIDADDGGAAMDDLLAGFLHGATEQFADWYGDRMDPAHIGLLRDFAPNIRGYRRNRVSPRTVVHGDYRLDNLLFRTDPDDCIAVDWQTAGVGSAGSDLSYCIATSLPIAVRAEVERDLIAGYGARLRSHGADRSDAELWDDYVFGLGHGVVITVLGAFVGTRTERGDDMFIAMAERLAAAMLDHGSLGHYR